jgi:hypothetical protein
MGAQFTGKLSSGFADAFMSFVDGSKDAGQAFEDMTVSIISDMLRMQLQQQAMSLMQGMMGTPQYSGGTVHNGGIVGEAPIRYLHNGTTGNRLVPGDRPAMLKDGEEVVTQQGQRDRARASRAPQVNNAIFIDQKQFADFMLKNPHYVAQIFNGNPSLFRR